MTIREWLRNAEIPDEERGIRGLDVYGDVEITKATWLSFWKNDGLGGLQHWCGGLSLVEFRPVVQHRHNLYLIVNGRAADSWRAKRRAGQHADGPCPNRFLEIVQSG